jgi:hypothetical protein
MSVHNLQTYLFNSSDVYIYMYIYCMSRYVHSVEILFVAVTCLCFITTQSPGVFSDGCEVYFCYYCPNSSVIFDLPNIIFRSLDILPHDVLSSDISTLKAIPSHSRIQITCWTYFLCYRRAGQTVSTLCSFSQFVPLAFCT